MGAWAMLPGYGMRGGRILVRDGCGWRVGIHMKQYGDKAPAIVIGGDVGSFLGEYMAGGVIVLMGTAGPYLATGMHGGVIYLKHVLDERDIPAGLVQSRSMSTIAACSRACLANTTRNSPKKLAVRRCLGRRFFRLRPANSQVPTPACTRTVVAPF